MDRSTSPEVLHLYLVRYEVQGLPDRHYDGLLSLFYDRLNATPLFEVKDTWLVRSRESAPSLLSMVGEVLDAGDRILILPVGALSKESFGPDRGRTP